MAYEDSPEVALERIMRKSERALKRVVFKLHSDLTDVAPVGKSRPGYTGGEFKRNWKVKEINAQNFVIWNNVEYASILWRGRRPFPNASGNLQMYGSKQWYNGGDPMLAKANIDLTKLLDKIKE